MTVQNTQNSDAVEMAEIAQPHASVPRSMQVLVGAVVVFGLIPAAYLGNVGAQALAKNSGTGGPIYSLILVGIAAIVLGIVGATAFALASKLPKAGAVIDGVGVIAMSGLSLWLFINVETAREGLLVFGITVVVLALMSALAKLFGGN